MIVLSLFDGISCGRVALEKAGIKVDKYYASEIDKYAIEISQKNFPDNIQVGNIVELKKENFKDVDIIVGGSPCQDLSIAKKNRKGLSGERSGLFWEYVRLLKEIKPKWFLLENVNSMSKENKQIITDALGVEPIMINAALVSAQSRKRLFWTNIPNISQPDNKGLLLKDILEPKVNDKYFIKNVVLLKGSSNKKTELRFIGGIRNKDWAKDGKDFSRNFGQGDRVYSTNGKSATISAFGGGRGAKTGLYLIDEKLIRKLTPIECERLQCLPDNFTEGLSDNKRYQLCGNAFNVDIVSHIFKNLI